MSIQDLDVEGPPPSTEVTNDTLYVPDGIYNSTDSPDNDDHSPATLSVQSAQPEASNTSLPPTNDIANSKLCGVCKEKEYKYKCSRCYLP